jgi:hypothetical protein
MIYLNNEIETEQKMRTKYDTINKKIKKLKRNKENNYINSNTTQHTSFKRTENMTYIVFTED